jgi:hypothetical protein
MMRPIPIYLAVEDALSEWVARRILSEQNVEYAIGLVFQRGGFGYLKKNVNSFNNAAKGCPFLLLTDLDEHSCAPELITNWLMQPLHKHLLFRVAVREVESWLLGDVKGLFAFLRLKKQLSISNPEDLRNPKQELLKYALMCPVRNIRDALAWRDDRTGLIHQGPDYNGTLGNFVRKHWDVSVARKHCNSLDRLFLALQDLEDKF